MFGLLSLTLNHDVHRLDIMIKSLCISRKGFSLILLFQSISSIINYIINYLDFWYNHKIKKNIYTHTHTINIIIILAKKSDSLLIVFPRTIQSSQHSLYSFCFLYKPPARQLCEPVWASCFYHHIQVTEFNIGCSER